MNCSLNPCIPHSAVESQTRWLRIPWSDKMGDGRFQRRRFKYGESVGKIFFQLIHCRFIISFLKMVSSYLIRFRPLITFDSLLFSSPLAMSIVCAMRVTMVSLGSSDEAVGDLHRAPLPTIYLPLWSHVLALVICLRSAAAISWDLARMEFIVYFWNRKLLSNPSLAKLKVQCKRSNLNRLGLRFLSLMNIRIRFNSPVCTLI